MTNESVNGNNLSSGAASLLSSVAAKPIVPVNVTPQPVAPATVAPVSAEPTPSAPPPPSIFDNGLLEEQPKAITPPEEPVITPPVETPLVELSPEEQSQKSKEESIAALRRQKHEAEEKFNTAISELEETKSKLHGYESGEATPDKIRSYEERIGKLEPYERLHAFKLSEEYEREYIAPLDELKNRAEKLAKEYAVDLGKLNGAFSQPNKRELNRYLLQVFGNDEIAALEAREIVESYKDVQNKRVEAERNADQEWTRIKSEAAEKRRVETETKLRQFKQSAGSHWSAAYDKFKSSGLFPELTQSENTPTYNEITKPVVESAQKNMGMVYRWLGEQGVKEIPAEIGEFLAAAAITHQLAPITAASRNAHNTRAEELLRTTRLQNSLRYPSVASSGNGLGSAAVSPERAPTRTSEEIGREAASMLLRRKA